MSVGVIWVGLSATEGDLLRHLCSRRIVIESWLVGGGGVMCICVCARGPSGASRQQECVLRACMCSVQDAWHVARVAVGPHQSPTRHMVFAYYSIRV